MSLKKYNIIKVLHGFSYVVISFIAFSLANFSYFGRLWLDGRSYPSLLLVSLISVTLSYLFTKQNVIKATTQLPQLFNRLFEFSFLFSFFVLFYWFSINSDYYYKEQIIYFLAYTFIFLFIFNYIYIRILRRKGIDVTKVNTIVLGENKFTLQFLEGLKANKWLGFQVVETFQPNVILDHSFINQLVERKVKALFINWDEFSIDAEKEDSLRDIMEDKSIRIFAISEVYANKLLPASYDLVGNYPYVQLFKYPLDKAFNKTLKRLFDIVFSMCFFIFIGIWLFPIIIFINFLDSGFPIFFIQKRHGMDNKVFGCYKFRTMKVNKYSDSKITVKNDPRVTRVGRILRKTSLDELPQFWNVLIGDMSVVGPRPHMVNQNHHYNELIEKYNFRHYIKPGITGLSQVNGLRGEINTDKDMEERVKTDIYYIRNWSFLLDAMIVYRTVVNAIRGDEKAI